MTAYPTTARRQCLRLFLLLITGLSLGFSAPPASAADRPSIGLALSGGGARGAAHIGVLRLIERLGVPVDYVAGTSMGAVVGGLYAMGMSPDQIEATIEEIDWDGIFRDEPPRTDRRMRRKLDDRTFLVESKPGVVESDRKVNLVPALIQGQKLELALRKYTLPATGVQDFDDLRIPFRAVATDIVTGGTVVLGDGDLTGAIRASMAVPAVFAPVEIGDRLLVDGGLAMNLPVSVVRDMGADIVIAVDVGGPRREREEITDVLQMLDQIASLATWRSTEEQIATLQGRDVLIVPPLGRKVLAGDFNKMVEAISIGEQGASTRRFELRHLALPPERYAAYRAAHRPPDYRAPTIDYVRVENRSRLAPEVLESRLDIRPGELLDPVALDSQLATIYDQDNFENVRYRIEQQDGRTGVVVTANEKSWGTSSLQGGMELSSTTGGDSMFNIGAAYTMAPLNQWNGEWRTLFRIGEEPGIFTEIYQPLDPGERWYLQGGVGYLSDNLRLFASSSDKNPIAEYQLSRAGGGVELGRNLGNWGRLGLRYSRFVGDADVRVADPSFQGFDFDIGQIGLQFYLDTLDSLDFPRKGWAGSLLALGSRKDLGASSDYDQGSLSLLHALSWDRNSLLAGLQLGGSFGGEAPPQALFRLGGFLNLSGFNQRELSGSNVGIARGIYLRDLGTGLVKTYAGASLELGNVWPQRGDIRFDNSLLAGSAFVGADTFLGPLYLGYGYAEGGHDALYLILGRPWLEPVRGW